jgi:DNA-binding Lrp family transcriptional regulator
LKDTELKLISELLKNSHRSDRELSHALGLSQPTVSRLREKLEKEGYINAFTVIPNFKKLGYHMFVLTFFTWKQGLGKEEKEEAKRWALEQASLVAPNVIVIERGMGFGYNAFMASFHKDYSSYTELMNQIKNNPYSDKARVDSFIVDLDDEVHYRQLTFATLAKHLLTMQEPKKRK